MNLPPAPLRLHFNIALESGVVEEHPSFPKGLHTILTATDVRRNLFSAFRGGREETRPLASGGASEKLSKWLPQKITLSWRAITRREVSSMRWLGRACSQGLKGRSLPGKPHWFVLILLSLGGRGLQLKSALAGK